MTKCKNCDGQGIVGSGPKPWLQEGAKKTCPICKGTGSVDEAQSVKIKHVETPPSHPVDNHVPPPDREDATIPANESGTVPQ